MSRIFISYRREDAAWQAGRIYDRLVDRFGKESIFKDVDAIKAGDNFQECINEAVEQCNVLLAVIGQKWLAVTDGRGWRRLDNPADRVRLEIETAINRDDVYVIPILLGEDEAMPPVHYLPESMRPLCYLHPVYVRQGSEFSRDVEYVCALIERHCAEAKRLMVLQTAENLLTQAAIHQANEEFETAIAQLDSIIQLDSSYTVTHRVHMRRGRNKLNLGDRQGAISDYNQSIQLYPFNETAYIERGLLRAELDDISGALTDYRKAIELLSADGDGWMQRSDGETIEMLERLRSLL